MTSRSYLVTGGSGFLGAALVRRLAEEGARVRVLDNHWRGHPRRLAGVIGRIEVVTGDIRDAETTARAVEGVDCVVHLSAINGTRYFYEEPELVIDVAIRGTLNVIDACRRHDVRELVVASSSEAYQSPDIVPTPENVPLVVPDVLNPRYSYGGSKLAAELIALNYGRSGFDRVVVFRPHNVYGPDMGFEHVIPELTVRAAAAVSASPGRGPVRFPIKGDGSQTRAFIHIDDFTDGLFTVIERGRHLNVYHIGNPEEVRIDALARLIFREFGREPAFEHEPAPAGETRRRCPDIAKLGALGFAPRISLSEGLPGVVGWYRANSDLARAAGAKG
jgi:dTDP-glucose 4,6-dehydratase/UDP-glucose 4-epimerase